VDVEFSLVTDIASIITIVDLGEIASESEASIQAGVITANSGADALD
jgi:hypothetical protein